MTAPIERAGREAMLADRQAAKPRYLSGRPVDTDCTAAMNNIASIESSFALGQVKRSEVLPV